MDSSALVLQEIPTLSLQVSLRPLAPLQGPPRPGVQVPREAHHTGAISPIHLSPSLAAFWPGSTSPCTQTRPADGWRRPCQEWAGRQLSPSQADVYVASLFIRQRLAVARGGGLTVAETPALPQRLQVTQMSPWPQRADKHMP